MSDFAYNPATQQTRVRSYLKKTLPDCDLTAEHLLKGYSPMILVWMTHLVAAFAFVRENPRDAYRKLYRSFKDYYASNRKRLDALDLSFVLCVPPSLPNLEEFRSEVETDVYFCRKYVVPLTEEVGESFDRLPFLPLTSTSGESPRPPGAQTYMQQCGVPAALARQLAVPHQRSAENIARDCVGHGPSEPFAIVGQEEIRAAEIGRIRKEVDKVRLDSITIRNFRAYKEPREFDLSGDVTVIYGPNGFGKTSLFDAIDFAATGGIGRLGMPSSRFERSVAHLDSSEQDSAVSLVYSSNGVTRRLVRRVASRASAAVDSLHRDRKEALAGLTGSGTAREDRVDHLVSLFRATHIFGQEHQELGREFAHDCALPSQVVSRMLAFEDYLNARRKAKDVAKVLGDAVDQRKTYISAFRRDIEEAERAIENLGERNSESGEWASPREAVDSLRKRVAHAGIRVESARDARTFVRACRAALQARVSESGAQTIRLSELAEQVRALPSVLSAFSDLRGREERTTAELEAATRALGDAEQGRARMRLRATELAEDQSRLRSVAQALRWATATQPTYARLLARSREIERTLSDRSRSLQNLREYRKTKATTLQTQNKRLRFGG